MDKIADYTIIEKIYDSNKSLIYKGYNSSNKVIIKILKTKFPSPSEIARFKQEYELLKNFDSDDIVKIYDLIHSDQGIALILEDFDGISLKTNLQEKKITIETFLKIAIKISSILGNLHKMNIIHKDIKPANILINEKEDKIKLTDFGLSTILTYENQEIYNPNIIEGTLVYMSPEQTGRMNRPIDYRSDLYSLGITFYEMLTGSTPFKSHDPLEIMHSHIARKPIPPIEIDSSIPKIISDIIMKLLAKTAEERYQNALGLMADLNNCYKQFLKYDKIEPFILAKDDISIKFNIPQKLIGRDNEIKIIMNSFEKVSNGIKEIMLVTGYPGIGKSLLINEIYKPITSKRGYFIVGKYDRFRKNVPYSAIIQAFQALIKQILSENREKINIWKKELIKSLGSNCNILRSIIPDIALIIGEHPDPPILLPEESQNRFYYVFKNFIKIFAAQNHPIALFLDDLQWADSASFNLIKNLIIDPDINFFFLIGAYRNNEVDNSHNLIITFDDIKKSGIIINTISLNPLTIQNVNDLISNFLHCSKQDSWILAELIYKKTNGNPFFINQFLKTLYENKMLILDPVYGWEWDINKINQMQVTDNVVELMAEKIIKLPANAQNIIKYCACIGNSFDLETLSIILNISIEEILSQLTIAIHEDIIRLHDNTYKFYHDRIQEAAYSLLSKNEKSFMHYRIGNYILNNTKKEELNQKILYIVNQLNYSNIISSDLEKYKLAELNLMAGKKAKSSAAYEPALNYFSTGIDLIGKNCWQKNYALALSLHIEAAEAAYLNTDFNEMERLSQIILEKTKSLLDKVKIYEIKIYTLMAQNRLHSAIDTALKVLNMLKIRFPKKQHKYYLLYNLIKTKWILFRKKIDAIPDIPEIKDPYIIAGMRIISTVLTPAFFANPNLLLLLILKMINMSIKHGNSPYSPYCYACYGVILWRIGNVDNSYKMGRIALSLKRNMNIKHDIKTDHVVIAHIKHWKEHARDTLVPLLTNYQNGLESGELEFAAHSIMMYCIHIFMVGKKLTIVEQEIVKYSRAVEKIKQDTQVHIIKIYHQLILNLMGKDENTYQLKGKIYDVDIMLPIHKKAGDRTALYTVYYDIALLNYLFENYSSAVEYIDKAGHEIENILGTIAVTRYYFYKSLIQLATYNNATRFKQKQILKSVEKNQKLLKSWSHHAPMNNLHKYFLVEAEKARIQRQDMKAMAYYDQAIKLAMKEKYRHEEALGYELAAKFWLSREKNDFAQLYMESAYHCYSEWGAVAKVKDLEKKYSHIIKIRKKTVFSPNSDISTINSLDALDLSTVMKASQTISSEIDLGILLEKLIYISIENAGAEKGYLILKNENNDMLHIEAEGTIDKRVRVLQSIPVETSDNVPISIINYVYQTKENIVLDDACNKGIFINDPYIIKNSSKSILCMPIINKGNIIGILYLENNLITDVFTPSRIELLKILSTQAAISIENSRLVTIEKQNAILENEIKTAQKIQQSLLPKIIPEITNFKIAYKYVPMMGIGGDLINIYYNEKSNKLGLFICDVSGHGVPAALTATMVRMSLDFLWEKFVDKPAMVLNEIRNFLVDKFGGNFITACICCLDINNKNLTLSNAGHPPIILIKENGDTEMLKIKGRLINDLFKPNFNEITINLQKGDRFILYTDGIIEATNNNKLLGIKDDEFCKWIKEISDSSSSPSSLCKDIYDNVIKYIKKTNLDDDFAVIAVECTG